jgi:hypothetical protein
MSDLVEFLKARLDDKERQARYRLEDTDSQYGAFELDPEEALAEVEAWRRIVDLCAAPLVDVTAPGDSERRFVPGEGPPWAEPVLRLLALPYADDPDCREEWKP